MAVPQNSFVVYIGAVSNRRAFMKPYSLFGQAVGVLQKEGVAQAISAHFDEDNPQMPITIKALGAVADDLMQLYSTVGFGTVRITNAELRFARPNTKEQKYLLVFPNVREHHEIEETPIPFIQTTDATVFEPLNPAIVDIKAEYARAVFRHALANSNYDQNISEVLEREPGSEFNGYGIVERAYINQVTKPGRIEKHSRIYMKNNSIADRPQVSAQLWNSGDTSYDDKFLLFVDCSWTPPYTHKNGSIIDQLLVPANGGALLIDKKCLSQTVMDVINDDPNLVNEPRFHAIQSLIQSVDEEMEGSTNMQLRVGVHFLKSLIIRDDVEKIRCSEFVESSGESSPSKRAKGNAYVISRPLDVEVTFDTEGNTVACVRATVISRGDSLVVSLSFE
eukprot:26704_1